MQCSVCGNHVAVFGSGGGERMAQSYQTKLLGQLPLDPQVREQGDIGTPLVLAQPQAPVAKSYFSIARALIESLSNKESSGSPDIIFE